MNPQDAPSFDPYKALEEANEKLRRSESRFHTLFGLGNEGIVIIAADGKPSFISPSIKKVMGYTDAELMELSLGALVHPDELQTIKDIQLLAMNNPGQSFEYPTSRRRHKDGSYRWVEGTITNLFHDPAIAGFVTHFRDVTERKLAQKKVDENAHKYQTLIDNSADGIMILSADGIPGYISPAIEKILGYAAEAFISEGIMSLMHPEDHSTIPILIDEVLANPGVPMPPMTVRMKHKDGGWRWLEGTMTNMLHDPIIGGIVDNFRDITARKQAEEHLIYSNRLYNFISQINQTIVHAHDEQTLFTAACRIAVEFGRFEFAWIGIANKETGCMTFQASSNTTAADIEYYSDYAYQNGGPIEAVLKGADYYMVSDIEKRKNAAFMNYAAARGFKSAAYFAIKKSGDIIGTFNLYSKESHFFSIQEIALLQEAAVDISFALEVFEKDKMRTAAEKALQHKEQRLSQAQAIAHVGNWELDLASGVCIWSEEALRIYGLPEDQRFQSHGTWLSCIHPEDRERVEEMSSGARKSQQNVAFYHRIIRPDASIRYVYSQAQPDFDSHGKAMVLNGVVHDITDLKIAEATALKAASEKIDILESIRDAFFAVDNNWVVTYWNKEAEHFLETKKEHIMGKPFWDVFTESRGSLSYRKYHEAIATGQMIQFEDYYETLDRWFEISVYPSSSGLSVYFKDSTTKKQAESERLKMVEELVVRNKGLEQFSYIVSHNLRAPLANIKGILEELLDDYHSAETKKMLKTEMAFSVKRLDEVIVDLSDILQLKNELVAKREYVDLCEITDSVRHSIINLIDKEQICIDTNFEAVGGLMSIKSYLYSIFYNLISNSIKYRHPDLPPHIVIKSSRNAEGVILEFSDNGMGIDLSQKKDEIFRLYKRFHNHVEGKGMGLFMVKTQVEMLGGTITMQSAVNKGTSFSIQFPAIS